MDIAFFGISDAFLRAAGIDIHAVERVPLSASECEARSLLGQVFPGLEETIGGECAEWLNAGFKLEVESAACAAKDGMIFKLLVA